MGINIESHLLNIVSVCQTLRLCAQANTSLSLDFLLLLNQACHWLNEVNLYIRSQRKSFGQRFPSVLLALSWQFLPNSEARRAQIVCKTWESIWSLPLTKKKLSPKKIQGQIISSIPIRPSSLAIALSPKDHYVYALHERKRMDVFDCSNGKKVDEFLLQSAPSSPLFVFDESGLLYLATSRSVQVYNTTKRRQDGTVLKRKEWSFPTVVLIEAFTVANSSLYVVDFPIIHKSSLDGKDLHTYDFSDLDTDTYYSVSDTVSDIASFENGIFLTIGNQVVAVSFKGREMKILCKWGTQGVNPAQFNVATCMAITKEGLIYVLDSGNDRIQAFSWKGTYLFEIILPTGDNERFTSLCASTDSSQLFLLESGNLVHVIQLK
jgi:hypothetical protein